MTVRWTLQAASDLEQICDSIQKHSSEAALATARRV
jgi:plasmid stabilization system protein ParE